ncbi:recombinase family protein [Schinkia azotoformans]|uniref:Resolvase domain-containing protein n=1 Tax=Schinkia azotoformans LMG 9581 TaxID=1131731 RepID=K6BVW0_SCHAZ|nr:recombinase family protein [Schinkia azotoformans]EKN63045.1 Resolvase domain-containing protein [Schinkia azotoformans LMG 9581]MEC1639109.1 recombinase family protein [Schinkia azotoformans]MEC1945138.1 recombinase family protein [Schinkia azotoformans]
MKTVAYYRRSTNIQENSIEMQRQMARNLSYQKALLIDEEYVDDAVSSRKKTIKERQALQRLLIEIEKEKIQTLFVYKRDRLARNALEYLEIYHLLREKKINVIFTAENEVPIQYSPAGELIELLMAGVIQREGEQIVERIQETIKANFQRGITPGNLPYGYCYDRNTKTVHRNEEQLSVVKFLFDQAATDTISSIKELKNLLDIQNEIPQDKKWSTQMIKKVLANPTYMGERVLNISGEVLKSHYQQLAIVDEKLWLKAQQFLEQTAKPRLINEQPAIIYSLAGLLICKECKQPLTPFTSNRNNQQTFFYRCKEHSIKIEKNLIEAKVLDACKEFFQTLLKSNLQKLFDRYQQANEQKLQQEKNNIENEFDAIERQLITKTEKWFQETSEPEKEKLQIQLLTLYDKQENLRKQIEKINQEIAELQTLKHLMKSKLSLLVYDEPSYVETNLKSLFQDIVKEVVLNSYTMHITFKHPFLTVKEAVVDEVS